MSVNDDLVRRVAARLDDRSTYADAEQDIVDGALSEVIEAVVAELGGEESEAVKLVGQALFLRQHGERPPGAPKDKPDAETWHDWDWRAELFMRDREGWPDL